MRNNTIISLGIVLTCVLIVITKNDIKDEQAAQAHKIDVLERAIAEADAEAKEAYFQKWSKLNKEAEEKTGISAK